METKTQVALFSTFVMSMASAAMIEMGLLEDPISKKKRENLNAAKQHIDILNMLKEKTKGNLEPEEAKLIDQMTVDLKMQYAKKVGVQS